MNRERQGVHEKRARRKVTDKQTMSPLRGLPAFTLTPAFYACKQLTLLHSGHDCGHQIDQVCTNDRSSSFYSTNSKYNSGFANVSLFMN